MDKNLPRSGNQGKEHRKAAPANSHLSSDTQSAAEGAAEAIRQLTDAARKDTDALTIEKQRSVALSTELAKSLSLLHEKEAEATLKSRALEAQIRALELECNSLQPMRQVLESQSEALLNTKKTLEAKNAELESKLRASETQITEFKVKAESMAREFESQKALLVQRTELVAEVSALKQENQKTINSYRNFHQIASQQNSDLKLALAKTQNQVDALTQERDQLHAAFMAADKTGSALKFELRASLDRLEESRAHIKVFSDEREKQRAELSTSEQNIRLLALELTSARDNLRTKDAEALQNQKQVEKITARLATLEAGTLQKEKEAEELFQKVKALTEACDKATADAATLANARDRAAAEAAAIAEARDRATANVATLAAENESLQADIQVTQESLNSQLLTNHREWEGQKRKIFDSCRLALAKFDEIRNSDPLENYPNLNHPDIDPIQQLEALIDFANVHLLSAETQFEEILKNVLWDPAAPPPKPRVYIRNQD